MNSWNEVLARKLREQELLAEIFCGFFQTPVRPRTVTIIVNFRFR